MKPEEGSTHDGFDIEELEAYLTGYWLSDLANFSAFLFERLQDVNWVGFYLSDGHKLRLGPFCGKMACTEIGFSKGVCGSSFSRKESIIVDDVELFPGHIRCDSNSKSELVIPFKISGTVVGVLDIDSPSLARFTKIDMNLIEHALNLLEDKISNWQGGKFGSISSS